MKMTFYFDECMRITSIQVDYDEKFPVVTKHADHLINLAVAHVRWYVKHSYSGSTSFCYRCLTYGMSIWIEMHLIHIIVPS